jgi:hypothetical protein
MRRDRRHVDDLKRDENSDLLSACRLAIISSTRFRPSFTSQHLVDGILLIRKLQVAPFTARRISPFSRRLRDCPGTGIIELPISDPLDDHANAAMVPAGTSDSLVGGSIRSVAISKRTQYTTDGAYCQW